MEYNALGATGIQVSRFCLGTMMFGSWGNPDHDDSVRIIRSALDRGINFVDTADVYSAGESEEILGKAIAGRRDEVVLATKFFAPMGTDRNMAGGSRRWIMQAVDGSLRRLGVDHIDLYQQHRWDTATDLDETMAALTDLVHQGKIRSFGSSTFSADQIVRAQWTANDRGHLRYRCEQPPYSLFARGIEPFVLPTCAGYGMGVIVWGPLNGGWLSGKYRSAADFDAGSRVVRMASRWSKFDLAADVNQRKLELLGRIQVVADEAGLPLHHLALAWTIEHPHVSAAIIGPRTQAQMDDLLPVADIRLDADVLDALDEIVTPGTNVLAWDPSSAPPSLAAGARRRHG